MGLSLLNIISLIYHCSIFTTLTFWLASYIKYELQTHRTHSRSSKRSSGRRVRQSQDDPTLQVSSSSKFMNIFHCNGEGDPYNVRFVILRIGVLVMGLLATICSAFGWIFPVFYNQLGCSLNVAFASLGFSGGKLFIYLYFVERLRLVSDMNVKRTPRFFMVMRVFSTILPILTYVSWMSAGHTYDPMTHGCDSSRTPPKLIYVVSGIYTTGDLLFSGYLLKQFIKPLIEATNALELASPQQQEKMVSVIRRNKIAFSIAFFANIMMIFALTMLPLFQFAVPLDGVLCCFSVLYTYKHYKCVIWPCSREQS